MAQTETAIRNALTVKAINELIEILTSAGYDVSRTKDLQTLTFEVGEIDSGSKNYVAYGSIKFTLHKSDFSLTDAENEYEGIIQEREMRAKLLAEKRALAEADRAKKKAKREADKKAKENK